MPKDSITISEAMQKIREWMDEKNYEKAIQGCQEILQIDPENAQAKEILANAETLKKNMPSEETVEPAPETAEGKIVLEDPLPSPEPITVPPATEPPQPQEEKLEVKFPEVTPGDTHTEITFSKAKYPESSPEEIPLEHEEKTKHFAAYLLKKIGAILIIFIILGGIGYGGFWAYSNYKSGGIDFDNILSKINIFSKTSEPLIPSEESPLITEPSEPLEASETPMETETHEDYRDLTQENVKLLTPYTAEPSLEEPSEEPSFEEPSQEEPPLEEPPKREKVRRIP